MSSAIIGRIGLLILGLAVAFGVYSMNDNIATFVKNNAIDGCYATGRIQEEKGKQQITTPENYWFTMCMKQKGYTAVSK